MFCVAATVEPLLNDFLFHKNTTKQKERQQTCLYVRTLMFKKEWKLMTTHVCERNLQGWKFAFLLPFSFFFVGDIKFSASHTNISHITTTQFAFLLSWVRS